MLETLRKGAQTWVAKALLLILVASFGIWGISSSLVTGTSNAVVTVGDVNVSATDFRLAYERQLSALSQRFGTRLSSDQARALGVENQVYAELVAGAALDQLSNDMSLGLSEDRLAQLIAEDPAFRGPMQVVHVSRVPQVEPLAEILEFGIRRRGCEATEIESETQRLLPDPGRRWVSQLVSDPQHDNDQL